MTTYIQYSTNKVTEAEAKRRATYEASSWDFTSVWDIGENASYPILRSDIFTTVPDDAKAADVEVRAFYQAIEEVPFFVDEYDVEFNGKRYRRLSEISWSPQKNLVADGSTQTFKAGVLNRTVMGTNSIFGFLFSSVRGAGNTNIERDIVVKSGVSANNSVFFYFLKDHVTEEGEGYEPPVERKVYARHQGVVEVTDGSGGFEFEGKFYRQWGAMSLGIDSESAFPGEDVTFSVEELNHKKGLWVVGPKEQFGFLFSSVRGVSTDETTRTINTADVGNHSSENTIYFFYLKDYVNTDDLGDGDGGIPDDESTSATAKSVPIEHGHYSAHLEAITINSKEYSVMTQSDWSDMQFGTVGDVVSFTAPNDSFEQYVSGRTRTYTFFRSRANGIYSESKTREITLAKDEKDNEVNFYYLLSNISDDDFSLDIPEDFDRDNGIDFPDGSYENPYGDIEYPNGDYVGPGGVIKEPDGTLTPPTPPIYPEDNPYMPPVGGGGGAMSPYQPPAPGVVPVEAIIHITDKQTDDLIDYIPQDEFWDDVRTQELANNLDTFDFSTFPDAEYTAVLENRNRILIPDKRSSRYAEFIIEEARQIRDSDGTHYKAVYTSASFVELRKQKHIPPQEVAGLTPREHLEFVLAGTEWSPGIIDDGASLSLTLDSYTDGYEYLLLLAEESNMELSFHVDHNGYRVTGRYVNLRAQRGEFRGYEVVFGKNLVSVERVRTYSEIVTALIGVGPTPSGGGAPLEYRAYDEEALQRWGRNGRHLTAVFSPDTEAKDLSYEGLRDATIKELRKRVGHQSDYIVTLHTLSEVINVDPTELQFGDIVQVKDEEFNPPLRIAARIHTMKESIKHYGDSEVILSAYDDHDYGDDGGYQSSFEN